MIAPEGVAAMHGGQRPRAKPSVLALSVLVLPSLACSIQVPQLVGSTRGSDTGSVSFDYASGDCLLGCAIVPMMLGTTESVVAQLPSVASGASVTVDDPTIVSTGSLSVMCCTASSCSAGGSITSCPAGQQQSLLFQVDALAPGSTKVRVMNGAKEIDGIVLSVERPAAIHPTCGGGSTANLATGGTCVIDWTVDDASGKHLQASGGVTLTVADPGVAEIQGFLGLASSFPNASIGLFASASLQGVAAGKTQLLASVDGIMGEVSVAVGGR